MLTLYTANKLPPARKQLVSPVPTTSRLFASLPSISRSACMSGAKSEELMDITLNICSTLLCVHRGLQNESLGILVNCWPSLLLVGQNAAWMATVRCAVLINRWCWCQLRRNTWTAKPVSYVPLQCAPDELWYRSVCAGEEPIGVH